MNKSSIFLLRRTKNQYSFNKLPEAIYVDTCFWNEAYGSSYGLQSKQECIDFLNYCVEKEIEMYISGIVYDEIQHIIKRSITDLYIKKNKININKFRYSDGNINYKSLYENISNNHNIKSDIDTEIGRVLNIINEMADILPYKVDDSFNNEVLKLYKEFNYQIGISDLKHAIVCHSYGLNCIATRDGDYWIFDNMNIYTPDNDKYRIEIVDRRNVYLEFDEDIY